METLSKKKAIAILRECADVLSRRDVRLSSWDSDITIIDEFEGNPWGPTNKHVPREVQIYLKLQIPKKQLSVPEPLG